MPKLTNGYSITQLIVTHNSVQKPTRTCVIYHVLFTNVFHLELVTFGYERNKTIFGAPYDFRFAPHSLTSYYQDLRQLIEHASERNAGRKVVLVSHSLGGLVTLYFLRQQSQAWKDRYVHSFVPIATPWSGSVLMLHAMTSGYNFDIPLITPLTVRQQQRMSEASLLLVPRAPAWQPNDVLIATPTKNYSMTSYDEWFDDIGFSVGKDMKQNVQTEAYALEHPGVHMYCWYGSGMLTDMFQTHAHALSVGTVQVLRGFSDS